MAAKAMCCNGSSMRSVLIKHKLLIASFLGILLGFVIGFGLRPLDLSKEAILWIGIWGELFLRMLKLIILPLLITSLIVGK